MDNMFFKVLFRILLAFITVASFSITVDPGQAASKKSSGNLSGKYGKVRRALPRYPDDPCTEAAQEYRAASGHSAYAQSNINYDYGVYVCGVSLNRPTVEDAEKRAIQKCKNAMKRWKFHHQGNCRVYASK